MRIANAENGKKTGDGTEVGLFFPLPPELASQCPSLGEEDASPPHVTFLYVGAVPRKRQREFLRIVQHAFAGLSLVRASLGKTAYFQHPDKNQTIAHMQVHFSVDMRAIRSQLREDLLANGFEVLDSFPLHYHPHTTLAYLDYLDSLDSMYTGPRPYGGWDVESIEVWGLPKLYTVSLGGKLAKKDAHMLHQAERSKYKSKEEDAEGNVHYEYGPRQIAERHKEKAKQVEKLHKSLGDLRKDVLAKFKSEDTKVKTVALAVALIDATYERVGNAESAKNGHFGVTGWQARHLKFKGDTAILTYVGKSGVKHEKTIDDKRITTMLKEVAKGKSGEDFLLVHGDEDSVLTSADVNEYLSKFDVTAKDLRGYHANMEMRERLEQQRKKGPVLPAGRKEKDKVLKKEFDQALKETAEAVGHEAATLRSQYLVPGLEDSYLHDGTVMQNFQKKESTKSTFHKEEEEVTRLVRPSPKVKPPRKDKRRSRTKVEDADTGTGDRGDDADLSLNYKRVGSKNYQSSLYSKPLVGNGVVRAERVSPLSAPVLQFRRSCIMPKMTKKGALQVVNTLDRIASLMQEGWETLGVPQRVANDMAYRCDLLSDHIEKTAGLQPSVPNQGFDPSSIAEEEVSALEFDADEPYTRDNFRNTEKRQLREKQEAGGLPEADQTPVTTYNGGKNASVKKLVPLKKTEFAKLDAVVSGMRTPEALAALETLVGNELTPSQVAQVSASVQNHRYFLAKRLEGLLSVLRQETRSDQADMLRKVLMQFTKDQDVLETLNAKLEQK
jgi:DNA topoisomerase-1